MSIAPDMLYHLGGVPVGAGNFAGWWGNDVWFVDFDNGIRTSQQGKNDIAHPQKDLYQSITDAGPGDTIYMRERTTVGDRGSNNTVITPAASEAANWAIPQTLHHLSIIGTTTGGGLTHGVSLRSYASLTTATIRVIAPFVTFENIGFLGIASQVAHGLLQVESQTPGTHDGFACVVNRCNFQVYKSSNGGACNFDSGRYNRVMNSDFWHNYVSVELASTYKNIQGNEIIGNTFRGEEADIDADILIADSTHNLIHGNIFDHAIPAYTSGIRLKYINVVGTAAGLIANNWFGTTSAGLDETLDESNMLVAGNICGADTAWMTST